MRAEAVELRPLRRGDRAAVLEIFAGLGERSRHQRFLTPKTRLTNTELRQLTAVDHHHFAVLAVATDDASPVGIARFIRDRRRPEVADVAMAVVDAWQGRGIGRLLATALAQRAVEIGVRRFEVLIAHDNQAALRLAGLGEQLTLVDAYAGTRELVVTLPASAGWDSRPAESAERVLLPAVGQARECSATRVSWDSHGAALGGRTARGARGLLPGPGRRAVPGSR